ncbi:CAAX protease self-immunity-domain containing protein [Nitzschia inconspicua]|uniref:CAAX protease self-immunity-domain containing protein n=1 Tax=Nitzschia inconspicua TaxID=303405 RepID=A0A9K3PL53_9STRA|nr:CAAX protease self-immunity-domain containing protein [Nitzschia inconspicua]
MGFHASRSAVNVFFHPAATTKCLGHLDFSGTRRHLVHPPSLTPSSWMTNPTSKFSPTKLQMKSSKSSGGSPSPPTAGFNVGLIAQNLLSQALLGSTIWFQGPQYQVLTSKAEFGPIGIGLGVVGLIPLLFISRQLETSDSYLVSGLNLSTNMAVLRLFGSKPQPVLAGIASLAMSALTGVVEETTFRGQLLPFFANNVGNGDEMVGLVLSSLLFAFLHTNPQAFLKGGEAFLDNFVLFCLQFVNGSIFAFLYLSTGNLAVPIIAHALYDFYTFYKTHLVDVAGQMQYASEEAMMPNIKNKALERKWIAERGEDFVNGVKQSFFLMDTNRDGVLSPRELRIALFSYGINLSKAQTEKVAAAVDMDEDSTIDLDEFLAFVGPTKGSTAKAVRYTLFGPI